MTDRPGTSEYASFYAAYVAAVPPGDLFDLLHAQRAEVLQLASVVPPEAESFRYAAGKWSLREVVCHMTDAERVFGYRAFCISRGEDQPLPSFDEDAYVAASGADAQPLGRLVEAFGRARAANLDVFEALGDSDWLREGVASDQPVSVRALACIMIGHAAHHLDVLRTRYGVGG